MTFFSHTTQMQVYNILTIAIIEKIYLKPIIKVISEFFASPHFFVLFMNIFSYCFVEIIQKSSVFLILALI